MNRYIWRILLLGCLFSYGSLYAGEHDSLRDEAIDNLNRGKYLAAQEQLHKLVKLHENNIAELAEDYRLLGELNRASVNFDAAIDYLNKSLALNQKTNDRQQTASILNRMSAVYFEMKKYELAKQYAFRSNELAHAQGNMGLVANNYTILGAVERGRNIDSALHYFHRALKITDQNNSLLELKPLVLNNLALLFEENNMPDSVIVYAAPAFDIALENKINAYVPLSGSMLAGAYSANGDFKNAYEYLRTSIIYRDSLYEEGLVRKIAAIEDKYEKQRREHENELLKARVRNRNLLVGAALLTVVLISVIAFILFKSNSRRKGMLKNLEQKNKEIQSQKKELQESNEVKDRLFSIISHDLRRPFNSLKGVFTLLQQNLISEEEWKMLSVKLGHQLNASSDLLDNLLLWAQSQASGFKPLKEKLEIKELTDENFLLLHPQADSKGIQLVNKIPDDLNVLADSDMVKLVMRNLISNAIKFSSSGDSIAVDAVPDANFIKVSVSDTGVGMPDKIKNKLFETTLSLPGTSSEKGTGIGLMLCKEFVQKNGGNIWLESEEGKGSTFYFTLPLT